MRILIALLLASTVDLHAANPLPARCRAPEASDFDFMVGRWKGTEHAVNPDGSRRIASRSEITVRKILGGCAIEEEWIVRDEKAELFRATLLRVFDRQTSRWMLSYIDDNLTHQVYEGRKAASGWAFHRTRNVDGKPVHVRITWLLSKDGYVQTIERSTDGEATWTPRAEITYTR